VRNDYLFCNKGDLRSLIQHLRGRLEGEIANYSSNDIHNVSEEDLCRDLIKRYHIEAPRLREDEICMSEPISGSGYLRGISVTVFVPFDGEGELFDYRTPTYHPSVPYGRVVGQEIHIDYENVKDNESFEQEYKENLGHIRRYLEWAKTEIDDFNKSLESFVRHLVAGRKEKLLGDQKQAESIGIPIRRRDDIPKAYRIPITRKRPKIVKSRPATEILKPEPFLDRDEYENILEIICSMSLAMERSPRVFSGLQEEEIRDFFLVFLNGHYGWEGHVTGETFNFTGKTDILIRFEEENVFIAECKAWHGPKTLSDAIDQLLKYTTWRNTKTAILLFSRRKNFSPVLEKINDVVKTHDCYENEHKLKRSNLQDETIFSYIFHQPEDKSRKLLLTVMAFSIPNVQDQEAQAPSGA